MISEIEHSNLIERINYNPDTGIFTWKTNRINSLIGKPICEPCKNGYINIRLFGKRFLAHRLAWFYVNGSFPENQIDHINGIKSDNRIENLRECSHHENHQNIAIQSNSTSGFTGVGWHKARKKWRAHITHNRKHIHLGLFDTKEAAYSAYLNAKAKYHLFQPTPRA